MLADLLGLSCGGNLTHQTFCPDLFCKIPLDKLFHARYTLHTLLLTLFCRGQQWTTKRTA